MSATVLGELLVEFQDAYEQYGREPFYLIALTQQEHKEAVERDRLVCDDEGTVLGYVALRDDDSDESSPLHYVSRGDNDKNAWHICVGTAWAHQTEQPHLWDAPFSLYRSLAKSGGAHLPRSIRDSCQCNAGEPVSAWLTFLWWFDPPVVEAVDLSLGRRNSRVFSNNPFLQSADAIERCALNTPNPVSRRRDEAMEDPGQLEDRQGDSAGKLTVNERMSREMATNCEAMGWSVRQWSTHLKCGKSTVGETETWKNLELYRLKGRAERSKGRRRKPKGSDLRRD